MSWIDEWAEQSGGSVPVLEPRAAFDGAAVAIVDAPRGPLLVYDRHKVIDALVAAQGMTYDEALDWFGYNIEGSKLWAFLETTPDGPVDG